MLYRDFNGAEFDSWTSGDACSPPLEMEHPVGGLMSAWAPEEPAAPEPQVARLLEVIWPHVPALRKYLQRRLRADDVDDAVQDTLLRIIRRSAGGAVQHPKCYLFQVAHACVIDRRRREASRRAERHCELSEDLHPVDDLSPLRVLLAREEMREVEAILAQLPERTRAIIIAMRLEGSSLKGLAARYNISISAVEKHITRAIRALSLARRCEPEAMPDFAPHSAPAAMTL